MIECHNCVTWALKMIRCVYVGSRKVYFGMEYITRFHCLTVRLSLMSLEMKINLSSDITIIVITSVDELKWIQV